jgi:coatomer subunit beta
LLPLVTLKLSSDLRPRILDHATFSMCKVLSKSPAQTQVLGIQQTLDGIFICLHMYLGVIFGNVVYDSPSGTDTHVVILNDVHADIMDYIQPATCSETAFRTMWTEFEWENKVNINKKNASTLREFLEQLMKSTNMSCLTPEAGLRGDCQFLSANLYAKSVFGKLGSLLLVNVKR